MIKFDLLRQYTHKTAAVKFPVNKDKPFFILYFSENSTFLEDLPFLNLRRMDIKTVVIPQTGMPRTKLLPEDKKNFRKHGWFAYSSNDKLPSGQNVIFDISKYLQEIEKKFNPKTYRQRAGSLIKNMILKSFSTYPNNYQKTLLYSVNTNKVQNNFVDRKFFPMLMQLKDGSIPFDNMLFSAIHDSGSIYRLLVKDKKYKVDRIIPLVKSVKINLTDEEREDEINKATDAVIDKVEISDKNKNNVVDAIKNFLKTKTDDELEDLASDDSTKDKAEEITVASILSSTSGDEIKASRIAAKVKDKKSLIKSADKTIADEIIPRKKSKSTTSQLVISQYKPAKIVDEKTPAHIFEKRKIDFEKNLEKDIKNSFSVLKAKDIPLKVKSIDIINKKQKGTELAKSDVSTIIANLVDDKGKIHEVKLDVPTIGADGMFKVNGKKKCLINQIVLIPISFPKPYDSKFESSYSTFHIESKRTKKESYLRLYMGGYWVPLSIIMSYGFGLDSFKQFGIKYKTVDEKPESKWTTKISDNKWVVFENVNSPVKEEFTQSFIRNKLTNYDNPHEFGTKEFFGSYIEGLTGRVGSTYLIQNNIDNIVDPVAKQVLMNKQLPFTLPEIMRYMSLKVVEGYKEDRNDLNAQRIRNSEVLVHFAQKQILAAYTTYREQRLSGNENAVFELNQKKVLSDFTNSQIVVDIEYANPIEEMATLTRVSPVGKNIGGIPDKNAIQQSARNVHQSYFGNIDPLDTPEGENIGIVQHLTVDALITSSRGIFKDKKFTNNEGSGILSTSAVLIPFVENNDGARVMFGCNQSRQSIPLKHPEPPSVQSGYESLLTNVLSDSFIKKAPCDGKVISITDDAITFKCEKGENIVLDISPIHLHSGSGKDTLSVFKTIIKEKQKVKKGQIVAEGSCVNQGTISIGRSLLTAVMPYKGFNFEDGIVISDKLVKEEKLTSLHGVEVELLVSENDRVLFINEIGKMTEKGESLIRKSAGEIEELIGFEEEDEEETEISAGQIIKKSPGGKIVDIEVYSNTNEEQSPQLKTLINRTNKRYGKKGKEKFTIKGESIKGILVKFKIEQELPIGLGDKLTNRHGAKGIISLIEKEENMPLTPWGERIEILVNPIGIIGRMNMGQLYELYIGLISNELGNRLSKLNDKKKVVDLLQKVIPVLDNTKNKEMSTRLINNIRAMKEPLFKALLSQIKESGKFPIIIPPFKSPKYPEIIKAMKILKLDTGYILKLPEYNAKTLKPVPVGYMYFLKLEQIGREKLHGRSTGPVTGKTMQPTGGKSREGGQRMGELDTYSFISYNALHVLSESFGPLSDDAATKNEMIADVVQNGRTEFRETKNSPVKDLLNYYFTSLILERR